MAHRTLCGVIDYITDGVNGYLVPLHDHEALAERVNALLADPESARKMAELALQDLIDKYTLDTHAQQRLDFIDELFRATKET